jgi:hypothetical protein
MVGARHEDHRNDPAGRRVASPAGARRPGRTCRTREQTIAQELKSVEDPTLLKRRSWLDTEWNRFRDGSSDIEETLGVLWSWRVSSTQDWAVRLKLPYDWHRRRPYCR